MQTRNGILVGKLEAQSFGIVAQNLNIGQFQVDPSLVAARENFGMILGRRGLSGRCRPGIVPVETDTETGKANGDVDRCQRLLLGCFRGVFAETLRLCCQQAAWPSCNEASTRLNEGLLYLLQRLCRSESLTSEHFDGSMVIANRQYLKSVCVAVSVRVGRQVGRNEAARAAA